MLQPSLLLLIWPIPFDHNIPMLVILVDVPNKVAGVVYRAVDSCTKFKNVYKNTFYAHQTSTSICRADKVLYMTLWLYIWGTVLAKRRSCSNKQFPSSKILPTPRLLVSERFCSFDLKCCERIVMRVLSLDSQSLGQKHFKLWHPLWLNSKTCDFSTQTCDYFRMETFQNVKKKEERKTEEPVVCVWVTDMKLSFINNHKMIKILVMSANLLSFLSVVFISFWRKTSNKPPRHTHTLLPVLCFPKERWRNND